MGRLEQFYQDDGCSLYEIFGDGSLDERRIVASTPETRAVCNDPLVIGVQYTNHMRRACTKVLSALNATQVTNLEEDSTCVLHVLRGGLNFGLRESLADAYGWNRHSSAFISAQRARKSENPDDWYITENDYQKVYLPEHAAVVFGDVVATGTSLLYALKQLLEIVERQHSRIDSLVFFTIGGRRAEEILEEVDQFCRREFPSYRGSTVVYFEGRFAIAETDTPVTIKLTGTDLLRRDSLMAPEFIESQYENPTYPLERCTIYDAGSRAFWLREYLHDVKNYWEKAAKLAEDGVSFLDLLKERFPELSPNRFSDVDLRSLCRARLAAIRLPE